MVMRRIDVLNYTLAAVLLLASVPMYRFILEQRSGAVETPPVQQPSLSIAQQERAALQAYRDSQAAQLAQSIRVRTTVECRNGQLFEHTADGREVTRVMNGRPARCEIQAAPVRPQSSQATD